MRAAFSLSRGRDLGRDEHVIGGRLSVLHDDRRLLSGVPGHAHAVRVDEVGEVLPRGGTQDEPARPVHGGQPDRGDDRSRRLGRPEQAEHDRSTALGDGDRLPRGRVDDLAGDESAADERERGQIDLLARQAFAAGHRDADAILRLGQEIVAPLRHREAKASGLVRGGEGLLPFVDPPGRDHGPRGGLPGDAVRHGPRHDARGRQRDDDIRRQCTRPGGRLGIVRVEHGEAGGHRLAIRPLEDAHVVDLEPALGVRRRREEAGDRPVVGEVRQHGRPGDRSPGGIDHLAGERRRFAGHPEFDDLLVVTKMEEGDSDRPAVGETEDRIVQAVQVILGSRRDETREGIATVGVRDRLRDLNRRRSGPFHPIQPHRDPGHGRAIGVVDAASADGVSRLSGLLLPGRRGLFRRLGPGARHGVGQAHQGHREQQAGRDRRPERPDRRGPQETFDAHLEAERRGEQADEPRRDGGRAEARRELDDRGGVRGAFGLAQRGERHLVAGGLALGLHRAGRPPGHGVEPVQDPRREQQPVRPEIAAHEMRQLVREHVAEPRRRGLRHERFRQDDPGAPGPHDAGTQALRRHEQCGSAPESEPAAANVQEVQHGRIRDGAAGRQAPTQDERGRQELQPQQQTACQPDRRQDPREGQGIEQAAHGRRRSHRGPGGSATASSVGALACARGDPGAESVTARRFTARFVRAGRRVGPVRSRRERCIGLAMSDRPCARPDSGGRD